MYKILVCGGREFDDWDLLSYHLTELHENMGDMNNPLLIIEGGAKGADFLARVWAKYRAIEFPVTYDEFPANWKKYGKAAGHIRNQQMLDEVKPDLVVAFPGGTGTADMVKRAKKAGITVLEYEN